MSFFGKSVGELREELRSYQGPQELRRLQETVRVWRPLQEALLRVVERTVQDDWPFQHYPEDWSAQAERVVARAEEALSEEVACHFPQRSESNIGHLLSCVRTAHREPTALSGREVGLCRAILKQSEAKYGRLGSEARGETLEKHREQLESELSRVDQILRLQERLESFPEHAGISDFEKLLQEWPNLSPPLRRRLESARSAPVSHWIESGAVRTLEGLLSLKGGEAERERELLTAWLDFLPHFCAQGSERRGLAQLLKLSSGYFVEPMLSVSYGTELAPLLSGSLYAHYYRVPTDDLPELLTPVEKSAQTLQAKLERQTLCGGDVFALAHLGYSASHPERSAERCWEFCCGQAGLEEVKPYRRLRRHRSMALAWRQMVAFFSFCSQEQVLSSLSRFEKEAHSELRPHLERLLQCVHGRESSQPPWSVWFSSSFTEI